jgi:hypothetical protein
MHGTKIKIVDWLVFLGSERLPEDGTPVSKQVGE